MMSTGPPITSDETVSGNRLASSDSLSNIDLQCPQCDYNLTGLRDNRCPECGEAFDPAKLTAWMRHPNQPVLYSGKPLTGLLKIPFTSPKRIGRELAVRCSPWEIGLYGLATKSLAAVVFFAAILAEMKPRFMLTPLMISGITLALAYVVESLLGVVFAVSLQPRLMPCKSYRYRFWRNLCRCFSFFLTISAILFWLGQSFDLLPYAFFAFSLVWWWVSLARAVCVRSKPSAQRVLAILLILVIGLGAMMIGIWASAVAFMAIEL